MYQEQIRNFNQAKILLLIETEDLTFKEIIERSELSRAVVNQHLKNFVKNGYIKKEYRNGKIVNILQKEVVNPQKFFFEQLLTFYNSITKNKLIKPLFDEALKILWRKKVMSEKNRNLNLCQEIFEICLKDNYLRCTCDEVVRESSFYHAEGHYHHCMLYQVTRAIKLSIQTYEKNRVIM
jgi:DNA-binding transcriptional ArsR family regulator